MQIKKDSAAYCVLAIVATTLWGSAFAGAKIGFEYMPPMMLSGFRFMLAGVLLLPLALLSRVDWRAEMKHLRFMLLFGLVQTFLQYGLFYMGLNLVPSAIASVIIGAGPLFVALMAHFTMRGDRLSARTVIAVVLGVAGVAVTSLSGADLAQGGTLIYEGIALLLASNLVGSYTNIMVAKKGGAISSVVLTMVANFAGGALLLFVSLFVEPLDALHTALPVEFYLALVWLAIIPAAGFSIWYYLLSLPGVKVSELNIWKFLIPIVGVLLSWWLLPGESPTAGTVAGIIIISSSVVVLQFPTIRAKLAPRRK